MLVCVALLATVGRPAGSSQPSDLAAHLFTPRPAAAPAADTTALEAGARLVEVAAEHLADDRLVLDLPAGRSVTARQRHAEPGSDGSWIWSGMIEGEPLSAVTFVRVGALVQGSIRSSSGAFSLEPAADGGGHLLRQVDLSRAGAELLPLAPPALRSVDGARQMSADDGGTIDVFVVYTAAARQQAGGSDAAVKARIALGVAETNEALANSNLASRLRLVGSELVGYHESEDLSTDLRRLTSDRDGMIDEVHVRRRAVAADLVQLVVGSVAGGACGVAWVMQTVSVEFAPYAFSVTAYPCISPNYTFGHELAHNMGTAHAPQDPNAPPAFPYAFGYKDPKQRFRTVMAYDCPAGCPRVLHFSNPTVTYNGQATGTEDLHNNALALAQTVWTVSNFGFSRPGDTLLGAPTGLELQTQGTTVRFSWDPPAVGSLDGYVLEVGSDEGFVDVAAFHLGASDTSLVQTQVPPGSYWVRVRGVDANGPGAPSASVMLRMTETGRCLVPVSRPTLRPPLVTDSTVTLAWTTPAAGHPVERYLIGAGTRSGGVEAGVIDTATPALGFTADAGPGVYFVRVAGVNACGVGAISNEVPVVVGPPIPGPPAGLQARLSEGRLVTFTWLAPTAGGDAGEYAIEAGTAPGLANLAVLPTGSPVTSFAVEAPPGRYFVRVRALNLYGSSVPSDEIELRVP